MNISTPENGLPAVVNTLCNELSVMPVGFAVIIHDVRTRKKPNIWIFTNAASNEDLTTLLDSVRLTMTRDDTPDDPNTFLAPQGGRA